MPARWIQVLPLLLLGLMAASHAQDHPDKLLFGDTHVHTSYSFDAYLNQNRSADPETAFRYASGLPVIHPYHRARVSIKRPLDFLVVSDHAEMLGVISALHDGSAEFEDVGWYGNLKRWFMLFIFDYVIDSGLESTKYFADMLPEPPAELTGDPVQHPNNLSMLTNLSFLGDLSSISSVAWQDITASADRYNEPGVFSAFAGWEWTSIPVGANLHRVVITPDNAQLSQQYLPYGADKSQYPEDLWDWLATKEQELGARFVAIPHNSNISKGYMFAETTLKGKPMTPEYARKRLRWEPLVEITQMKGDSETHPDLSPEDPFAAFEEFPFYLQASPTPYRASPADYVRSALNTGLRLGQSLGVNPYQFGVIGSTDSHTGLASIEEDNFWGKLAIDSIPENKSKEDFKRLLGGEEGMVVSATGWDMSASGLAAVWAEDNTRDAIYAALRRKEVYATTGPRIGVRFFGGWDYLESDAAQLDFAQRGYLKGVPMGSALHARPNQADSPIFMISVSKDPEDVPLDRIQVIKGWVDELGNSQEAVIDIAPLDTDGISFYSGTWSDSEFDPKLPSFYYLRVLQQPTPRHSFYDKQAREMVTEPGDMIRERAYTSAIWYSPDIQ